MTFSLLYGLESISSNNVCCIRTVFIAYEGMNSRRFLPPLVGILAFFIAKGAQEHNSLCLFYCCNLLKTCYIIQFSPRFTMQSHANSGVSRFITARHGVFHSKIKHIQTSPSWKQKNLCRKGSGKTWAANKNGNQHSVAKIMDVAAAVVYNTSLHCLRTAGLFLLRFSLR